MANTEGKRKINFLDFLLIVLIIATISAAIVSVIRSNPNQISGGDAEIVYKIKCEMVDATAAKSIQGGDTIYDNETNQLLGTLVSHPTVTQVTAKDESGADVDIGKVTVVLEVKAQIWKENGIYSIDGYRISEGKEIMFHSEGFSYTGLCTELTLKQ